MEGRFAEVDGLRIHYYDAGAGEPTVLIHGGGPGAGGLSNYRRNIGPLSEKRRVLAIDLPGFGESANQHKPGPMLAVLGEIVTKWLDALGVPQASFVGNSLGGGVALQIALDDPARVRKLVLMGSAGSLPIFSVFPSEGLRKMMTFYDGDGPTMAKLKDIIGLLVYDPSTISSELVEERLAAASRPEVVADPPLRVVQGKEAKPPLEIWQRLPEIRHPTLIVWGREDRVLPLDSALLLLKTIRNAELHVFPRCGHWVQWEKADAFNELVTSFLDRDAP